MKIKKQINGKYAVVDESCGWLLFEGDLEFCQAYLSDMEQELMEGSYMDLLDEYEIV